MRFPKDQKVIWHDRKRYFGLPWSFYRYYLVEKEGQWIKLFRHKGLLTSIIDEINIYRCYDISLIMSLGDKIFKTGTIEIYSNDENAPCFHLRHVANPYEVRDLLSTLIEQERKKKGISIAELQ